MNGLPVFLMEADEVLAGAGGGKAAAVPAVTEELTTALVTGVANASNSVMNMVTQVLPYALGLAGVIMAISFGYAIFRRFAH